MRGPATDTQITHLQRLWLYLFAGLVMLFLVLPVLIVVPLSFSAGEYLEFPPREYSLRWYENYLTSTEWMDATWVSLKVAVLTTLVATPLGVAAAYGLHASGSRFARTVQVALLTPLLVPIIIIAIGVFYFYAKASLLNTTFGLVCAHAILAIPFVMVTVTSSLKQYDLSQERAARSLGAPRLKAFMDVTMPQIKPAVLSGGLFAFITSLDEVVIALFISNGEQSTLTRRMFASLRDQIDPTIAAISTLLVTVSVLLLVGMQLLRRQSRGR
jgi:putative spermidine/putrescine transport system permease protein